MSEQLSRWRYLTGAACGLIAAAGLAAALHKALDRHVWSAVHKGPDSLLAFDTWLGLEPPAFALWLSAAFLLLVPLGALLMHRRRSPAAQRPAVTFGLAAAAIAAASAALWYVVAMQLSWCWVLQG